MKAYRPPAVQSRQRCLVEGCTRPEELVHGRSAGGLCRGHRKRKCLGQELSPLDDYRLLSPKQALVRVALALADVDTADDRAFVRGVRRLTHAAVRYTRSRRPDRS